MVRRLLIALSRANGSVLRYYPGPKKLYKLYHQRRSSRRLTFVPTTLTVRIYVLDNVGALLGGRDVSGALILI